MCSSDAEESRAYAQGAIGAFWHVPSVLLGGIHKKRPPARPEHVIGRHVPATRMNPSGTCPAIDHLSYWSYSDQAFKAWEYQIYGHISSNQVPMQPQWMQTPYSRGDGCVTSSTFKDASHLLYYGGQVLHRPRNHRNTRHRAIINTEASARRKSMRMQAAEVARTFQRLDVPEHPLATYPLRLPKFSSDVSSSSESSESEDELSSSAVATEAVKKPVKAVISVCQGKACQKRNSSTVLAALSNSTVNCSENVVVQGCKCLGQCKKGPAVRVQASAGEDVIYVGVKGTDSALSLAAVVMNE